jgi:cyclic pyranopterin phosphate synthase
MIDNCGRKIEYLRLSLTERCTLKCEYCRADEGICPKKAELSADEFVRVAKACAQLGINKVRLTGGEPMLRRDIVEIVSRIAAINGIGELTMTTNAQQLVGMSQKLKTAGLARLNISMDSLDPDKYRRMTGGELEPVLTSIDEAIEAGLLPLKVNAVVVRGTNDDEIDDFIAFAKDRPVDVRFIELMPMGRLGQDEGLRVPSDELIAPRPYLIPVAPRYAGQPSSDYLVEGHLGRIGFISPISHKFCGDCNRIRILSDGMLRPCLGKNGEISLKEAIASGDEGVLLEAIRAAVFDKPVGHNFEKGFSPQKDMSKIGG